MNMNIIGSFSVLGIKKIDGQHNRTEPGENKISPKEHHPLGYGDPEEENRGFDGTK